MQMIIGRGSSRTYSGALLWQKNGWGEVRAHGRGLEYEYALLVESSLGGANWHLGAQ